MVGAAIAALMGPARADECGYLHARLLERNAVMEQTSQAFLQFGQTYGDWAIAHSRGLWAAAQRLEQQARSASTAQLATARAMLADNCVAPGDLPGFRK
jgi:hypothetical protein